MTKSANGSGPDAFGRVFRLKEDLRQRDVAAWNRAYIDHPHRVALADERQAALEAAIAAGWVIAPETRWEDVTDGATGQTERRYYLDGVEIGDLDGRRSFPLRGRLLAPFRRRACRPKSFVLAVAAYAEDGGQKPPELDLWLYRDWGAPYPGGWMEWPAAEFARARVARNIYTAMSGYRHSSNLVDWANANPQAWELVSWVLTLREEARANGGR